MELEARVKTIIVGLLNKLSIAGEVKISLQKEVVMVDITSPESGMLIGSRGQTLDCLQHLIRLISQKQFESGFKIMIDIANYKKNQNQQLVLLVNRTAARVIKSKVPESLRPMNAYQRRLVHLTVRDISGITTSSIGQRNERRVIIKPAAT